MVKNLTIDPKSVMAGFCWAYANGLLRGLNECLVEGDLFPHPGSPYQLGLFPAGLIRRLQQQLGEPETQLIALAEVEDLCARAERTLSLFFETSE